MASPNPDEIQEVLEEIKQEYEYIPTTETTVGLDRVRDSERLIAEFEEKRRRALELASTPAPPLKERHLLNQQRRLNLLLSQQHLNLSGLERGLSGCELRPLLRVGRGGGGNR